MVSVDYLMVSGTVVSVSDEAIVLRGDGGAMDVTIRHVDAQKPKPGDRVALTCQIDGSIDLTQFPLVTAGQHIL